MLTCEREKPLSSTPESALGILIVSFLPAASLRWLPSCSTVAVTPVLVIRTKGTRSSNARKEAKAMCICGSPYSPNHESLVRFRMKSGLSAIALRK